ncbi:palmitoyltransferase [Geosmithia morbida]|uniref:Palmitoyltransferase PFA4 n=1 Tax=Geosmithia morbida TaxID=1094350 RepID=A0A9P5D2R4_9HYPO|nr:palmitoyltransferase [Geosmithia morbida]KAF4121741.1 palmitoyltransferase [Geosmithia morbida]
MAGLGDAPLMQYIAVPAVCLLITFLGFFSQYLFHYSTTLDPGPPSRKETITFNILLAALYYTYFKTVSVDPGRYVFADRVLEVDDKKQWCSKCEAPKPPRAHHCRHCQRCIPKMDHHCPWTNNCVSMTTFPHFIRFLIYANLSLWMMGYLLFQRFYPLWESRNLPSYLGPSLLALVSLSAISVVGFFTSVALFIMLVTTAKSWLTNQTTIEGWEVDRHEAIAERGGRDWWDITGPNGKPIRFEKIEFPYDIGFFANMAQAMGTSNILWWFFPFASNPKIGEDGTGSGWTWEENGFNRMKGMWPPLDPEKIRRANRTWPGARRDYAAELKELDIGPEERKEAFRQRQEQDLERRKKLVAELEEVDSNFEFVNGSDSDDDDHSDNDDNRGFDGAPGWTNSDGERLRDYGVDEEAEDLADDNIPLAELIRRRKGFQYEATTQE